MGNKIQMPSGMGGLVRYFDEYKSKITFKPGHIVVLCVVVIIIMVILHLYGNSLLGIQKMMPGMNPRKMQQMMKKMGIAQTEVDATEVIIKCSDREIIITEPSVSIVKAMGNEQYTISGTVQERALDNSPEINEDEIKTVMDQANVDENKAKEALESADGNIAKAIMDIQA